MEQYDWRVSNGKKDKWVKRTYIRLINTNDETAKANLLGVEETEVSDVKGIAKFVDVKYLVLAVSAVMLVIVIILVKKAKRVT